MLLYDNNIVLRTSFLGYFLIFRTPIEITCRPAALYVRQQSEKMNKRKVLLIIFCFQIFIKYLFHWAFLFLFI